MSTKPNQAATTDQAPTDQTTATANTTADTTAPPETTAAPAATPTPDEFGRLRVKDRDTGHERTITASELPHGNYTVLKQRASDRSGDPLPPKHASR